MATRDLQGVLDAIGSATDLPIVVFDLDSTLFLARSRNLRILQDFAEYGCGRYPDLPEFAASLTVADLGYMVDHPLSQRGLLTDGLKTELRAFWAERFFTDDYCEHDQPTPGAPEFAQACHEAGALIYYLTGRHISGMALGTTTALVKQGFPLFRGRTVLHLKPTFEMPDGAFKKQAVADIHSYGGSVVATFENEPGHADTLRQAFPEGVHFLLDTVHSPTAPEPHPEIVHIPDFRL
ncbi:MAG: HAD family hydrolase [Proteobacteria bacterium]|nr:HAD family hydrolase [Pseudomonadota bacterium]